jgi:hypothetical protein
MMELVEVVVLALLEQIPMVPTMEEMVVQDLHTPSLELL